MDYEIEIYQSDNGKRPFSQWLKDIKDHVAKSKIRVRLDRLKMGNFGQCEPVGEGVFELKIDFGPALLHKYLANEPISDIRLPRIAKGLNAKALRRKATQRFFCEANAPQRDAAL